MTRCHFLEYRQMILIFNVNLEQITTRYDFLEVMLVNLGNVQNDLNLI